MKRYLLIFIIIIIAGFLRFYHLTRVPPALNSDEVAIGYNAYSILKTGRDEYNKPFPLTFRSFDDYKMPVYVYLVAVSMAIFGFGDFAVRFPSAFFGTCTVLLTYLLVRELFATWGNKRSFLLAIFSSFLLAISPWSIQFSRAGYEANVAVFFIVCGSYLFLVGLKKTWTFFPSVILLSLAVWTYLTARIFVPLLVLGFAVVYAKQLWKKKIAVGLCIIFAVVLLAPIAIMSLSPEGQMRAAGVSAFDNPNDIKKTVSRLALDNAKGLHVFTIFDNRRLVYATTFLRGYFSYFDLNFLFLDKSIDKYRAPDAGLLYLFELPLLLAGSYIMIRKWNSSSAILFWWIIISPVAGAFTQPPPHPVRSLVFLPSFQIIGAVGALTLAGAILHIGKRKKVLSYMIAIACMGIVLVSVCYYFLQYFVHLPVEDAKYWYVGRKEMVQKLATYENQYDRIIVSNELDFPYIFFLYYRPVNPTDYLKHGGTISGGFAEQANAYGIYEFRSISSSLRVGRERILYVGLPDEVFKQSLIVDSIYYPDGSPAIVLFK